MLILAAAALITGSIGDFITQKQAKIPDCKITYRAYGTPNADKSNVVIIPTWFNGVSEDWTRFIGPGGLINSSKYYVLVLDALGNGHSSSPSNHPTLKGQNFPSISIQDMVESHHRLLVDVLKLDHIHAVMGVSMGGMQAFQWLVSYPDYMNKAISIVGTPRMSAKDVALWSQAFKIGAKQDPTAPKQDPFSKWIGAIAQAAGLYEKYKQPFNALRQFEALAGHDVSRGTGLSLDATAERVKAKAMVIVATKDQAISPELPLHYAELVKAAVVKLDSACGHKAYDCQKATISGPIAEFLAGKAIAQR